ncbi:hypothetical protein C7212DRAFT_362987 [Tuber magnatum]|uniref:Uncharacterized protein n=1 Tax=Tuber magnatum TaxID=42249 RepID=A0A317SVT2_9PEZI|nr:hypothetical protein C7212DRAFT_362987 [Tuber magnatum]
MDIGGQQVSDETGGDALLPQMGLYCAPTYPKETDLERNATFKENSYYYITNGYRHSAATPIGRVPRGGAVMMPAFGGAPQPGPYKLCFTKPANPGSSGLCAFILTTLVLGLVSVSPGGISSPNIAISLAYGCCGLVQISAVWGKRLSKTNLKTPLMRLHPQIIPRILYSPFSLDVTFLILAIVHF